jgi:hypothetical protein
LQQHAAHLRDLPLQPLHVLHRLVRLHLQLRRAPAGGAAGALRVRLERVVFGARHDLNDLGLHPALHARLGELAPVEGPAALGPLLPLLSSSSSRSELRVDRAAGGECLHAQFCCPCVSW